MKISKMKKEDLELLSNKDITKLVLEESKKPMNTADLFKKIIELLELPESSFENKIGDYYTSLSTDKRFLLLEDGCWDLKSNHTSDKVKKNIDSIDEEYDEEEDELPEEDDILNEEIEDDYSDDDTTYEDTTEDLKDLVVLDEDDLGLEE
ncbi:MAG: DNA-directed RNA polymerase subunit delta [Bacilli bacterium]|nr:DNA-directed RNA polymerase subunit delta [Bacilli bacterium]